MDTFIKFDGKKSSDFGLKILNDIEFSSASYDVETIEVPGRDGVLLKDNQRLIPIKREFPMEIHTVERLSASEVAISDWLNVKGWKEMELSWEPDYIYLATFIESFNVKELLRNFGEVKLNFLIHPIKFLKTGRNEIPLTNGMTLKNLGNVQSKPLIKIRGNGNGILTINGYQLSLESVQNELTIDMQKHLVYSGNLSAWDKITRNGKHRMPLFDVGDNIISWTGNFTMTAVPNWGVKL